MGLAAGLAPAASLLQPAGLSFPFRDRQTIRHSEAFQAAGPGLHTNKGKRTVISSPQTTRPRRVNTEAVPPLQGELLAVDIQRTAAVEHQINFLIFLMPMHEGDGPPGRQGIEAHLCSGKLQQIMQFMTRGVFQVY
ncbi:hypothetical protein DESPIG_02207 [Desulfovibrio piger ATCC 29098]|uniref:Uncharacterized protein n=1 Tax=Desulfovibrio piger ATCC 29098 TaxID=411464 RepID=B6WVT9_9BACT|nr:hypothetical protein DESPIG_02207 [Desulfovibrio piger ATCC 29098]